VDNAPRVDARSAQGIVARSGTLVVSSGTASPSFAKIQATGAETPPSASGSCARDCRRPKEHAKRDDGSTACPGFMWEPIQRGRGAGAQSIKSMQSMGFYALRDGTPAKPGRRSRMRPN
jgi:hypothetical protein